MKAYCIFQLIFCVADTTACALQQSWRPQQAALLRGLPPRLRGQHQSPCQEPRARKPLLWHPCPRRHHFGPCWGLAPFPVLQRVRGPEYRGERESHHHFQPRVEKFLKLLTSMTSLQSPKLTVILCAQNYFSLQFYLILSCCPNYCVCYALFSNYRKVCQGLKLFRTFRPPICYILA